MSKKPNTKKISLWRETYQGVWQPARIDKLYNTFTVLDSLKMSKRWEGGINEAVHIPNNSHTVHSSIICSRYWYSARSLPLSLSFELIYGPALHICNRHWPINNQTFEVAYPTIFAVISIKWVFPFTLSTYNAANTTNDVVTATLLWWS